MAPSRRPPPTPPDSPIAPVSPASDEPRELFWPAVAFAAVVLLYVRTLAFGLVWDDVLLIVRNPALHQAGAWVQALLGSFWGAYSGQRDQADYYRPIASLSFWLDHRLWGAQSSGYHLTNVLLAAAGASLLAGVLRFRFGFSRLFAGLAGLLFAVHPLHAEAVPFVSDRTDLLCLDFFLGWLWLWPHAAPVADAGQSRRLAMALVALLLALGSKEMALLAPLVLWWERRSAMSARGAKTARAASPPLGTPAARAASPVPGTPPAPASLWWTLVPIALFGLLRAHALAGHPSLPGMPGKVAGVGPALLLYGRLLLWPVGAAAEYVYPPHISAVEATAGAIAWAVLAMLALWPAVPRRVRRAAGLTVLFALPGALPGLAAARFLYFSTAFACATLAALLEAWLGRLRDGHRLALPAAVASMAALALAWGAASWARVPVWRSNLTLFEDSARRSPGSSRAWINLGTSLEEAGRLDQAERALRRALAIDPGDERAMSGLALVLRKSGQYLQAESLARRAVSAEPADVDSRFNLATVLYASGKPAQAALEYRLGLAQREDPRARLGLALALSDAGDPAGALEQYRRYLQAAPDDSLETLGSMAWELFQLGRLEEAERDARAAVRAPSPSAPTLYTLGAILLWEGRDEGEAMETYRRGLQADRGGVAWASGAGDVVSLIRAGRDTPAMHVVLGLFAGRAGLTQARAREGWRILARPGAGGAGRWRAVAQSWAHEWNLDLARREARPRVGLSAGEGVAAGEGAGGDAAESAGGNSSAFGATHVEELRRLLWGAGVTPEDARLPGR